MQVWSRKSGEHQGGRDGTTRLDGVEQQEEGFWGSWGDVEETLDWDEWESNGGAHQGARGEHKTAPKAHIPVQDNWLIKYQCEEIWLRPQKIVELPLAQLVMKILCKRPKPNMSSTELTRYKLPKIHVDYFSRFSLPNIVLSMQCIVPNKGTINRCSVVHDSPPNGCIWKISFPLALSWAPFHPLLGPCSNLELSTCGDLIGSGIIIATLKVHRRKGKARMK